MIVAHQPNFTPVRINPSGEESSAANIKKIFLAEDDDEDFNLFNAAILTIKSSIQVMRIKNGIMFSSLIETSLKPDIIILDLNMPYKNGLMCLQEVKSKQHLKSVKVIIYSTSSSLR
ncbi:MAG TPA: response regulator, partial [Segetibacter sp.]